MEAIRQKIEHRLKNRYYGSEHHKRHNFRQNCDVLFVHGDKICKDGYFNLKIENFECSVGLERYDVDVENKVMNYAYFVKNIREIK